MKMKDEKQTKGGVVWILKKEIRDKVLRWSAGEKTGHDRWLQSYSHTHTKRSPSAVNNNNNNGIMSKKKIV
jgi:hypothetical protein